MRARHPNEPFAVYKFLRHADNSKTRLFLRGRLFWDSGPSTRNKRRTCMHIEERKGIHKGKTYRKAAA